MRISRRAATFGLLAAGLAACTNSAPGAISVPAGPDPAFAPQANAGFDAWLAAFRPRAAAQGISDPVISRALRSAGFLPGVVERDRNQAEFSRTFEDYLSIAASDERIAKGQAGFARYRSVLTAVEQRYGVEAHVVAAVWGLESFYGERRGTVPVISALATLAYDGRRGAFFESQLIAALKILQAGDVTPERMLGSWAGAMGHTQFIPTSYLAYAVDFTGDGRRDIWSDDPSDSLASTASYLARSGWQRGQPWGVQVQLPAGFSGPIGRSTSRSVAAWSAASVRNIDGGALPNAGDGSILLPAGPTGPAFLVFRNFAAILRYNNSEFYALGVGHLSDRILGRPAIRGSFPPDATGLTKADRLELQTLLNRAGYDVGTPDGVIGAKSKSAISAFQQRSGMAQTGTPSPELLAALRRAV